MGALNCVPKDDTVDGQEEQVSKQLPGSQVPEGEGFSYDTTTGPVQGGAPTVTAELNEYRENLKKEAEKVAALEKLLREKELEVKKYQTDVTNLQTELEGQRQEEGGVEPAIDEKLQKVETELAHKRRESKQFQSELLIFQEKNTVLNSSIEDLQKNHKESMERREASFNDKLEKGKSEAMEKLSKLQQEHDETQQKLLAEKENLQKQLEATNEKICLTEVLTKIQKSGRGKRVKKFVCFFTTDNKCYLIMSDDLQSASSLAKEEVLNVSNDPAILPNKVNFSEDDLQVLLIIQTPKKKVPFLCSDKQQRDYWLKTIESRL